MALGKSDFIVSSEMSETAAPVSTSIMRGCPLTLTSTSMHLVLVVSPIVKSDNSVSVSMEGGTSGGGVDLASTHLVLDGPSLPDCGCLADGGFF